MDFISLNTPFDSSGSDEGSFDCDTVIQSVKILGMEHKPSAVSVLKSGEETCGKIKATTVFPKKTCNLRNSFFIQVLQTQLFDFSMWRPAAL